VSWRVGLPDNTRMCDQFRALPSQAACAVAFAGAHVSLDVMPGSSHDRLSDAGWKVFLAAFPKAAAKGD
jgi:hypothetical protein